MKEAHYVDSNIPIFLKNAEFVYSVDKYQSLQCCRNDVWTGRRSKDIK